MDPEFIKTDPNYQLVKNNQTLIHKKAEPLFAKVPNWKVKKFIPCKPMVISGLFLFLSCPTELSLTLRSIQPRVTGRYVWQLVWRECVELPGHEHRPRGRPYLRLLPRQHVPELADHAAVRWMRMGREVEAGGTESGHKRDKAPLAQYDVFSSFL
jgi:hypothetical protein